MGGMGGMGMGGRRLLSSNPKTLPVTALESPLTLVDHTHWLCDRGSADPSPHANTAAYGDCVASGFEPGSPWFQRLDLTGLPPRETPGFAGLNIDLVVVKKDIYSQKITADSSSKLQLYSALAGEKSNDDSISFVGGTVFSGFQEGQALFSIGIKPTFTSVSISDKYSELHRSPFLYAQGIDFFSGAAIETKPQEVHLASRNRTVCPVGLALVRDSSTGPGTDLRPGMCTACTEIAENTYNSNPLTGECLACPPSAYCSNGAPPLFGAQQVVGSVEMELLDGAVGLQQAMALKFGVETWQLKVLSQQRRQSSTGEHPIKYNDDVRERRRSTATVSFEIVADPAQMAEIERSLAAIGVELEKPKSVGPEVAAGEVWEEVDGQFLLRLCPPGNRLINTTSTADGDVLDVNNQRCSKCLPNTYIVDPLGPCIKCPAGATCPDGIQFLPNVDGSIWEDAPAADGWRKRPAECPAGYIIVRGDSNYDADECKMCEYQTYSLDIASINPGDGEPILVEGDAAAALARCLPCPEGGICLGGNDVSNAVDWWRNEYPDTESEDSEYANMTLLRVFGCKPGYCEENSTCLNGSTGVLCSLCLPNHAMSGGICTVCTSEDADVDIAQLRSIVLTVILIVALLLWLVLCCRSLIPAVQAAFAQLIGFFVSIVSGANDRAGGLLCKFETHAVGCLLLQSKASRMLCSCKHSKLIKHTCMYTIAQVLLKMPGAWLRL